MEAPGPQQSLPPCHVISQDSPLLAILTHIETSLSLSSFIQEAIGILQRACVMGKYKGENMRAEIPSASQRRNFLTNIT